MAVTATMILAGSAQGTVLKLDEPLSFWGGVDPATGALTDPRSPHCGTTLSGRVLILPETRGSSSSSAIMLELLRRGLAPAALVLGRNDAILGLGILVAREMGWPTVPLLTLDAAGQAGFETGDAVEITADGTLLRK